MEVTLVEDAAAFAERAGPWLATEPLSANVLAVQLAGVLDGTRSTMPGSVWALVTGPGGAVVGDGVVGDSVVSASGDRVVGAAMHTSPLGVFLPRLPPGAADVVATAFLGADRLPTGASGVLDEVDAFATSWERLTGLRRRRSRATRLQRLGELTPPTDVPGGARPAGPGDLDLVRDWFRRFARESGGPLAGSVDVAEVVGSATRKLAHGEIRLWTVDGRPVSLASVSAPAVGVSRIGPVFTPPADRGRGFAAAVTAAAAADALLGGASQVVLYTDLDNPTAAGVYRRIGFVPEFDADQLTFVEPAT